MSSTAVSADERESEIQISIFFPSFVLLLFAVDIVVSMSESNKYSQCRKLLAFSTSHIIPEF